MRQEETMKKSVFFFVGVMTLLFSTCVEETVPSKITIDTMSEKKSYGEKIAISPLDDSVTITRGKITLAPHEENVTYTISGYFAGQIVSTTKNTIIKLNNAYLENMAGRPVIRCSAKTEISTAKNSTNYIVSRGRSFSKIGAIQTKRALVLGGSGTLYVKGSICHGIEAEDVKLKGTGIFYIEGTRRGSALTCESLSVEKEKSFAAYFLNAKNGIKADDTISIQSGNFHLYNNGTAFKTDLSKQSSDKSHAVSLTGGTFYLYKNASLYETDVFVNEAKIEELSN